MQQASKAPGQHGTGHCFEQMQAVCDMRLKIGVRGGFTRCGQKPFVVLMGQIDQIVAAGFQEGAQGVLAGPVGQIEAGAQVFKIRKFIVYGRFSGLSRMGRDYGEALLAQEGGQSQSDRAASSQNESGAALEIELHASILPWAKMSSPWLKVHL